MPPSQAVRHRLFAGGRWVESSLRREVLSPFDGNVAAVVDQASDELIGEAAEAAHQAFLAYRHASRHARARLLMAMSRGIGERRADLVASMVREAGKPALLADGEASRAIVTFATAAEEAKRWGGEVIPVDIEPGGRAYAPAVSHWVPRGPVLAITPFNFPLNLVAHKVAPALACGAPVIVKPAPQAPGAAVILAEIFVRAAAEASDARETIPAAALQVLSCSNETAALAVADPRIATLSFTGSPAVGWMLRDKATRKKVALELGGNAAVIVHSDADLDRAAARCAFGAFAYAGQICISVQRIYAQEDVFAAFRDKLLAETARLPAGDPTRPDTMIGPVIDPRAADRIAAWIEQAKARGARVLAGGGRKGNLIEPTILTGVDPALPIACEEVFGPVAILESYRDFGDAIRAVNASRFGLQAGVFTDGARRIQQAARELECGGILINEIPTYRADNMPYGGVKESGLGREGVRYAMEEYSERRTVVTWTG